ncbi:alpha/beta hydrolase family protein [Bradyrhizobium australiense]|uniref:Alpha/beta hydrolase n=1 Tax=Bradyrhizobium australiense TaxID=2721161 RepID=A0A7Y4GNG6_9BRAD|nr:alpha/beta hydrolase [Bradyrhizobium australiense]NOJ38809.1 alpha/beta hydrolase [Bradyrhizobium australiense]
MKIHFGPGGWVQWPDSEEFSIEFMRLLGMAQEGGSLISECFLVASRIDPRDGGDSWYREWLRMADINRERAKAAFDRGHVLTAQSNWLRAINYYQASAFEFDAADKKQQSVLRTMRACARRYIAHLTPAGEVVEIPWLEGYPLEAYFLPAPAASHQTPVVVCMGDPGHRKEEYLVKVARYARERGMSLLAVDLLGSGNGAKFDEVVGHPDLETTVSHVMDYLTTRDDIDEHRIAILGDGSGSSFVARGVALDNRFAAAVCDGGIWDMHERTFLMDRLSLGNSVCKEGGWPGRKFRCPVLITMGGQGWLEGNHVTGLFERLKTSNPDISLKIFDSSETAAAQGHRDNPTLANEFIFDWMADRLVSVPA